MTSIHLPSVDSLPGSTGLADWDRRTRAEMIRQYRAHAARMKQEADAVLAARDSEFIVETYLGTIVRKNVEIVTE
jgi:hypothetical protein